MIPLAFFGIGLPELVVLLLLVVVLVAVVAIVLRASRSRR